MEASTIAAAIKQFREGKPLNPEAVKEKLSKLDFHWKTSENENEELTNRRASEEKFTKMLAMVPPPPPCHAMRPAMESH